MWCHLPLLLLVTQCYFYIETSVSSMGQINLFEVIFKMIMSYYYTLALKTLILEQSMKCLLIENDCVDAFL